MLIALLLAAATPAAKEPETIVVSGVPLSQLKAEAERCEKGGCTPRQDIVATVRYAEGLFRTAMQKKPKEFWHWVNAGGSYLGVKPQ